MKLKIVELLSYFNIDDERGYVDVYLRDEQFAILVEGELVKEIHTSHSGEITLVTNGLPKRGTVQTEWDVQFYVDLSLRTYKVTETVSAARL